MERSKEGKKRVKHRHNEDHTMMILKIRNNINLLVIIILLIFSVSCKNTSNPVIKETINISNDSQKEIEDITSLKQLPDGTNYLIHPAKLSSSFLKEDGIPPIDNPYFVSVEKANEWIKDNELILGLNYHGIQRVYPLQILVWHEIVNDKIIGKPIIITYCPLCGSAMAFEPIIKQEDKRVPTTFSTSGKLYNSNLVMYDRTTNTLWTQVDGKAIIGPLAGQQLQEISIDTVAWRDWKKQYPKSEVLSQKTGYSRSYGKDPYGSYYEDSTILFPVENKDPKIHPKTIIIGITLNGKNKAYKEEDLKKSGVINDLVNNQKIKIVRDDIGVIKVFNLDNGQEIVKQRMFWFVWYAFYPQTELYNKS